MQSTIRDDVAGADQLDSGGTHSERSIGLDRRDGLCGRHEHEQDVRAFVLGALKERREVGNLTRPARRDGIDHLAAESLEAVLEGVQAVFAGREVGIGDDRGSCVQRFCGDFAQRVARVPHGKRRAHEIRRQVGDERRAGIHDHRKLLAGVDDRDRCDGVGRIQKAGQRIDFVLGQRLLNGNLGFGAIRSLGVVLDEFDRIGFDRIGIEFEINGDTAINLLTVFGKRARILQDDADFHFLRRDVRCRCGADRDRHCGDGRQAGYAGKQAQNSATVRLHVLLPIAPACQRSDVLERPT